MDCPKCKTPMYVVELEQVETDYCGSCEGIWLDSGELEALLNDSQAKEELLHSFRIDNKNPEKTRRCPICGKRMLKVFVGTENPVLIDKCSLGHGLWFDGGELLEVIEKADTGYQSQVAQLLREMFKFKINK